MTEKKRRLGTRAMDSNYVSVPQYPPRVCGREILSLKCSRRRLACPASWESQAVLPPLTWLCKLRRGNGDHDHDGAIVIIIIIIICNKSQSSGLRLPRWNCIVPRCLLLSLSIFASADDPHHQLLPRASAFCFRLIDMRSASNLRPQKLWRCPTACLPSCSSFCCYSTCTFGSGCTISWPQSELLSFAFAHSFNHLFIRVQTDWNCSLHKAGIIRGNFPPPPSSPSPSATQVQSCEWCANGSWPAK